MHKGNDQATLGVEDANNEDAEARNEVEEFKNKRYVSGEEEAWQNRGIELTEQKPAVSRLQIHLPGEQTVFFDSNNKDESIERIEKSERTKLTSFFELNCKEDEDGRHARTLLYRDIPEHFTWNTDKNEWRRRKRKKLVDPTPDQIGRLYSIHPTQVQLYSLRLLLNHVQGPSGFEDIRTVDGVTHDSFQSAAIARKLVKNDKMWIDCMVEANESETNIFFPASVICHNSSLM